MLHRCSSGNGGAATSARLNNPLGMASAAAAPDGGGGWLIVRSIRVFGKKDMRAITFAAPPPPQQADTSNNAIRRVFANMTIVAVVGNGTAAQGADGLAGSKPTCGTVLPLCFFR